MTSKKRRGFSVFSQDIWSGGGDSVWRIFISVRLTITLLVSIILMSVLGTLIAQQGQTQVPIEQLYSPQVLRWLVKFGLTDLFHSAFFVFLILLLAINLIACSIERLPNVWRQTFHVPAPPVSDPQLRGWTPEEALTRKYMLDRRGHGRYQSVREAKMAVLLFFERHFKRYTVLRDHDDHFQIMVERGKYSRLGVYITHLSLLLVMFGSAIGAIYGFEGGMSIEEGTKQSWLQHTKGSNGGLKTMRENGVPVAGFLNLGFDVECERFTLETYDGQRPKAFRSILNFYENDVKTFSTQIEVNTPAVYKGITFYQASFQELGVGGAAIKVYRMARSALAVPRPAGRAPSQEAPKQPATVPGFVANPKFTTGGAPSLVGDGPMPKVESVEFVDNVKVGDLYRVDGNAAFRVIQLENNVMDLGPAAKMQFYRGRADKKPREFWIFKNLPGFDFAHRKGAELNFVLEEIRPKYATGLSVARDPGVWVVWIGSLLMLMALFTALYTFHSRYWVAYTKEDGFVIVGWSNKIFLFQPRWDKFHASIRKELKL